MIDDRDGVSMTWNNHRRILSRDSFCRKSRDRWLIFYLAPEECKPRYRCTDRTSAANKCFNCGHRTIRVLGLGFKYSSDSPYHMCLMVTDRILFTVIDDNYWALYFFFIFAHQSSWLLIFCQGYFVTLKFTLGLRFNGQSPLSLRILSLGHAWWPDAL